jgi:hypothetical protein
LRTDEDCQLRIWMLLCCWLEKNWNFFFQMHRINVLCKILSSKYLIRICSVIYKLKRTARKTSGQMLELSAINLQVVLDKEKTLVAMLFSSWYFHIFRKLTFTDTIIQQDSCHHPLPNIKIQLYVIYTIVYAPKIWTKKPKSMNSTLFSISCTKTNTPQKQ